MQKEAQEAAERVALQNDGLNGTLKELAQRIAHNDLDLIQICARGSSDHAGLFAKYVFERELKIPVASVTPSIASVHGVDLKLPKTLFIVISQSGQSPDIILSAEAAKRAGATILAIVNDTESPLAKISHIVLPMHAGPEHSVAATKSFICSLAIILKMVASLDSSCSFADELKNLPQHLMQAAQLQWTQFIDTMCRARHVFMLGRGTGYAIAREAALKLKETSALHAESYSLAEVAHGPMEIVNKSFPVLIFDTEAKIGVEKVLDKFGTAGADIFLVGRKVPGTHHLSSISASSPYIKAILQIQSFYLAANAIAIARERNPDSPQHLKKVTQTL
ncbi:MAG: SIS domain-containing protein [Cellvibrionales bacterium]|nr:SIS domain-containing protein [Cellvibrionales bacterium]